MRGSEWHNLSFRSNNLCDISDSYRDIYIQYLFVHILFRDKSHHIEHSHILHG